MLQDKARRPEDLRTRNIEARRQRILDAARRLISRGGVSALSMRKLAAESGLAVKTLYNLWGGREEILWALVQQAIDQMERVFEREFPLAEDPLARCRAIVTVSVRHLANDEVVFRPMILAAYQGLATGPSHDSRIAVRAAAMQTVALRAAIEQGLLREVLDPVELGRQIYHGYELAEVQWAFGAIDEDGFETRALYGLYVALLAAATEIARPPIEAELRQLESRLRAQASPARDTIITRQRTTRK